MLLVWCRQSFVFGIHDEDCQQACGFAVTRILADPVVRTGDLVEAFADVVNLGGLMVSATWIPRPRNSSSVGRKRFLAPRSSLSSWILIGPQGCPTKLRSCAMPFTN